MKIPAKEICPALRCRPPEVMVSLFPSSEESFDLTGRSGNRRVVQAVKHVRQSTAQEVTRRCQPGCDSLFQMYYGPCYISGELKQCLADWGFTHTRGKPYHPMTQAKIEGNTGRQRTSCCWAAAAVRRASKPRLPSSWRTATTARVTNPLNNVTPADVDHDRAAVILEQRERIKRETIIRRRIAYRKVIALQQSASY
jgi:hypothetical protein